MSEGRTTEEVTSIPSDWVVGSLGDIAALIRGIGWRKSEEAVEGIPVVTIPNVHDGYVDFDVTYRLTKEIPDDKLLAAGDILLVGSSGSVENIGRAAVVPALPFPKVTYASFLVRATPLEDKISQAFLGHLLASPVIDFRAVARRAADGKWNLQLEELKGYPVAYPPDRGEQDAICRSLGAVDFARASHQKRADALEVLFKSLRAELMAGRRRAR